MLEDRSEEVAAILSLIANPARLRILCLLAEGEMQVGALAERVGLSQSALSQHLAKLRAGGAVETRRDRQTIYYRLAPGDVRSVMESLYEIFCEPERERAGKGMAQT
ncbi:transcriptional regulator protein (repressor of nodulation genes), ArsR family [Fulvimarina pelagi HTCC2506]|uniref:Transcriptional regulator protein (Repressor of nodulation genes), ArsR family n=2 Tax=Fulvimarina pelagi TaxID=217511 RepID=Q0G015_9HYPH|nr:transcriptional regulator protein (repressor of nodulation genes), ArsR family [Fulvimarina pelagi HTCC2506]